MGVYGLVGHCLSALFRLSTEVLMFLLVIQSHVGNYADLTESSNNNYTENVDLRSS